MININEENRIHFVINLSGKVKMYESHDQMVSAWKEATTKVLAGEERVASLWMYNTMPWSDDLYKCIADPQGGFDHNKYVVRYGRSIRTKNLQFRVVSPAPVQPVHTLK